MTSTGKIMIGTSGWNYRHWRGVFYDRQLKQNDWLGFYAQQLNTVEINNTFYQLPSEDTFKNWKSQVPRHFIFAVKVSRYITHMKKLQDCEDALKRLFRRIELLGDHLGPLLFQLPPRWKMNNERLAQFIEQLSTDFRYAFEFRDDSWWDESIFKKLSAFQAAFCIFDLNRCVSPKNITTDFVYLRLHGPGAAYQEKYDTPTLKNWLGFISNRSKTYNPVYCYFDNDNHGYAIQNALQLRDMI